MFKFKNANNELKKILINNKNLQIILKTDCQGYDTELFAYLHSKFLKKIHMYFLECKELGKNKKNFYNNIKLFDHIFVSCPLIHRRTRKIDIKDLDKYFNLKVEFDLILLNQ